MEAEKAEKLRALIQQMAEVMESKQLKEIATKAADEQLPQLCFTASVEMMTQFTDVEIALTMLATITRLMASKLSPEDGAKVFRTAGFDADVSRPAPAPVKGKKKATS